MSHRTRVHVFSLILVFCIPTFSFAQTAEQLVGADSLVTDFMAESGLPGLSVAIGIDGHIVWSQGYGYADLEQRVPVWPAITRFRVGSVAKPMTAAAIGQLYEQGRLDLDAPVQQYVPSFPEKEEVITTRLLAGHLAGIRHYQGEEFLSLHHYPTVSEGLDIFQGDPLINTPGTEFSYSSYGWNLISAVIEGASGENFLEYMDEYVFKPLKMNNTVADQVRDIVENRTRYYEFDDDQLYNAPPVDNSYKWAGGGFLSTSEDLVRFGFAHLYAEILEPETVELLWTSQKTASGKETGYGIGWSTGTDANGNRTVGHGGGSVGGITLFQMYPDSELVIVMITNTSSVGFGKLPDKLANLFMQ